MEHETYLTHRDPHAVIRRVREKQGGFLTEHEVQVLGAHPVSRLWPALVRCGGGRFTCAMQDVAHFIAIIQRSGQTVSSEAGEADYVRDVSLIAGERYE